MLSRRAFNLTAAFAAIGLATLSASAGAQAAIVLNFSSTVGSAINFAGDGTQATFSLGAGNVTAGNPGGDQWQVTTVNNGTGSAAGLFGDISKSFSYLKTDIVIDGSGGQTATPVTTISGPAVLTIKDGAGFNFTADLVWVNIHSTGSGQTLNLGANVNLANIAYGGANADLQQLKSETVANGGITTLSFQFAVAKSLTDLVNESSNSTSYSGSITSAPEPTTLAMAFTGLPVLALFWRRRRAKA